jgi:hypothetical protein
MQRSTTLQLHNVNEQLSLKEEELKLKDKQLKEKDDLLSKREQSNKNLTEELERQNKGDRTNNANISSQGTSQRKDHSTNNAPNPPISPSSEQILVEGATPFKKRFADWMGRQNLSHKI